ncbi:MAG: hypothetical protein ACT4PN_14800 [Nitrospiraceae bacterium]
MGKQLATLQLLHRLLSKKEEGLVLGFMFPGEVTLSDPISQDEADRQINNH